MSVLNNLIFLIVVGQFVFAEATKAQPNEFVYPQLKQDTFGYERFGIEVVDPYSWVKDSKSKNLKRWVQSQNEVTLDYFRDINFKHRIVNGIKYLGGFDRLRLEKRGKYYFRWLLGSSKAKTASLFLRDVHTGRDKELITPEMLEPDADHVDIVDVFLSPNQRYLAISYSVQGSEDKNIKVFDLQKEVLLADKVSGFTFSEMIDQRSGFAWKGDGFYYTKSDYLTRTKRIENVEDYRFDEITPTKLTSSVYYHRIETTQKQDSLVFTRRGDMTFAFNVFASQNERFLVVSENESKNDKLNVYVDDLTDNYAGLRLILKDFEDHFEIIDEVNEKLLVKTDYQSQQLRLLLLDPNDPTNFKNFLPDSFGNKRLSKCIVADNRVLTVFDDFGQEEFVVFDFDGQMVFQIPAEEGKSFLELSGTRSDSIVGITLASVVEPELYGLFNIRTNSFISKISTEQDHFDFDKYEFKRHVFLSEDSVEIPVITINHKDKFNADGTNPTLLEVYGGYGIVYEQFFDQSIVYLLEQGGVYAKAMVRGGGELGAEWHEQGEGLNKENTVRDFIGAAEFLVREGFCKPEYLASIGTSHGGFVIASAMVKRPDLFRVAMPIVGVYDLLSFGPLQTEYGRLADSLGFRIRHKLSPYYHLQDSIYPSCLFVTNESDDRVNASQSYRMVARMQNIPKLSNRVLLWNFGVGHGLTSSYNSWVHMQSRLLAFMFNEMELKPKPVRKL